MRRTATGIAKPNLERALRTASGTSHHRRHGHADSSWPTDAAGRDVHSPGNLSLNTELPGEHRRKACKLPNRAFYCECTIQSGQQSVNCNASSLQTRSIARIAAAALTPLSITSSTRSTLRLVARSAGA